MCVSVELQRGKKVKCLYVDLDPWIPCQIISHYKNKQTEPYVSSGTENCNNAWWPLEAATFKSGNTNVNVNKVLTQGSAIRDELATQTNN